MKKLHELLGLPLSKGVFGVEIECEGQNLQVIDTESWITERDGSLRGEFPTECAEYVMRKPVTSARLSKVLDELIAHQKDAHLSFSFRTSAHVHINVQEYTEEQILAFIYACMLLEEPLMNFCGESRKGNRFCLRMKDAEGYDKTLNSIFSYGWDSIARLNGDNIRYSAINIHALRKYGSVEFRGMRGNMDRDVLIPWCHTLLAIRNAAVELGTPVAVYNEYIKGGNEEFAKRMMGKHFELFNYPGLDQDLSNSFSLTIQLPHLFKYRDVKAEVVEKKQKARGWIAEAMVVPAPEAVGKYVPAHLGEIIILQAHMEKVAEAGRINARMWRDAAFEDRLSWYRRNCV